MSAQTSPLSSPSGSWRRNVPKNASKGLGKFLAPSKRSNVRKFVSPSSNQWLNTGNILLVGNQFNICDIFLTYFCLLYYQGLRKNVRITVLPKPVKFLSWGLSKSVKMFVPKFPKRSLMSSLSRSAKWYLNNISRMSPRSDKNKSAPPLLRRNVMKPLSWRN